MTNITNIDRTPFVQTVDHGTEAPMWENVPQPEDERRPVVVQVRVLNPETEKTPPSPFSAVHTAAIMVCAYFLSLMVCTYFLS